MTSWAYQTDVDIDSDGNEDDEDDDGHSSGKKNGNRSDLPADEAMVRTGEESHGEVVLGWVRGHVGVGGVIGVGAWGGAAEAAAFEILVVHHDYSGEEDDDRTVQHCHRQSSEQRQCRHGDKW